MSARSSTLITVLTGARSSLLERTLFSFRQNAPELAKEATWLTLVNGGDQASRLLVPRGEVLVTESILGIGDAVSLLMKTALREPSKYSYLLHLEDDWSCCGGEQWFDQAVEHLKDKRVGQVRLRHHNEQVMPVNALSHQRIQWKATASSRRASNAHYTFNPSLVRIADARKVFPCSSELRAMEKFALLKFDVVQLVPGSFVHIGTDSLRERMNTKRPKKTSPRSAHTSVTIRKKGVSSDLVIRPSRGKRKRQRSVVVVSGPAKRQKRSQQRRLQHSGVPNVTPTRSLVGSLHPLLADDEDHRVTVSVVLGTYNRLVYLRRCVNSIRAACSDTTYEIVVGDGGSTDGSKEWLMQQDDVKCVEGGLDGAVKAFNACFERVEGQYTLTLNDDVVLHADAVKNGLAQFGDPFVGQVAFAFCTPNDKQFQIQRALGHPYANYGLIRTNVARAVKTICGGLWAPCYHTYGGDNELSLWVLRLGYRIAEAHDAKVDDLHAVDELRRRSNDHNTRTQSGKTFSSRWSGKDVISFRGPPPAIEEPAIQRLRVVEAGELPQQRWHRLDVVKPTPGLWPRRSSLKPERVLLVYIKTAEDPQQSMVEAFSRLGSGGFRAVDWLGLSKDQRTRVISDAIRQLDPTLVFMQLQGPDVIDVGLLQSIHTEVRDPSRVVALWSGDVGKVNGPWSGFDDAWSHRYASLVDVMLYTGTGQANMQRARGMSNAAYLQIGFDEARYFPGAEEAYGSEHSVVFLGQNYNEQWNNIPDNDAQLRRDVVNAFQKSLPRFAVFGPGWSKTQVLHQTKAGDVYRKSLMALNVSLTSKLGRYSSDRVFRAMACGTVALVKRFEDMEGLGLIHGKTALIWNTVEEALSLAKTWSSLNQRNELRGIGRAGAVLAKKHYTWNVRMEELSAILKALRGQRWR